MKVQRLNLMGLFPIASIPKSITITSQALSQVSIFGTVFGMWKQVQFSSVQPLSHVQLFATPWVAACQASLSITNSRSLLKLTSIESVMPSSHLILCRPLLFLPPIPPSISLFKWVSSLQFHRLQQCYASLFLTISQSLFKFMSIESVMPSSHLSLCLPLLFLPPIPPNIRVFQWVNSSHEVAKVLEFQL